MIKRNMYSISTETDLFIQALLEKVAHLTSAPVKEILSIDEDATQNKNFIITTDADTYFLKVYTEGSVSERVFESAILKKLHDDGYTFPIQPMTAEPFIVDDKPVMLFDTIKGVTLDPHTSVSDEQLIVLASQLAQMHTSLAAFNAGEKTRFNALGFEFVEAFGLDIADVAVEKALRLLHKAFADVDTNELKTTIIHDDLSAHNVMLSETGELRFVDFDDAHRSYRISDIGTVIKEFVVGPDGAINQDKIDLFIHYYEATHNTPSLTDQEKSLLTPMILRRALFMYAYCAMVEKERSLYLQSADEYHIVTLLTLVDHM